jgi:hypothetical protein
MRAPIYTEAEVLDMTRVVRRGSNPVAADHDNTAMHCIAGEPWLVFFDTTDAAPERIIFPPPRRPVGRPPSLVPLRHIGVKLSQSDLDKLDRIAQRDAGDGMIPNRTEAIRYLIRAECDRRVSPVNHKPD